MEFQHSLDEARTAVERHFHLPPKAGHATVRRLWPAVIAASPSFALPRHLVWLAESGQLAPDQRLFLVTYRATAGPDAPPRLRHLLVSDDDLSVRELPADA
jgi:hypothetical protein